MVTVEWQPDPLQQKNKHEHGTASGNSCSETSETPVGKSPDLEELQLKQRVLHLALEEWESYQQNYFDKESRYYPGIAPAHCIGDTIMVLRHQARNDTNQKRGQSADEELIAHNIETGLGSPK